VTTVVAARLRPYDLALKRPWRMAGTELSSRRGWLVEVETKSGVRGYGDYAIPPTARSAGDEERRLVDLAQAASGLGLEDALRTLSNASPVRWAMECALLDALARHRGRPLRCLLDGGAAARVAVNAVAEPDGLALALAAGYRVVKMKVGRQAPAVEAATLRRLDIPPGIRLRLDANCSWSWDDAAWFLEAVGDLPIESLEEPLNRPSLARLATLQNLTAIDLAVDESLPSLGADAVIDRRPVRRLVLKPAVLGGLFAALDVAKRARAAGMTSVVTTSLESAVGVAAAAHLAAAVDGSGLAHGLSTAEWLAEDVARPLPVQDAWIDLGNGPGLGVIPA
jgi:o-succinylbenzoate synthase